MSTNLVIAAIPDENDRVWKVSSDEIPHLTILHLGDVNEVSNLDQIMLFVEHAANTSLSRFYLPVDHRGELGEGKADVLFFKKGRYDFKAVRDFRSLLLKDENIKTAHDATSQFETPEHVGAPGQPWIPHLTLGYPETPAKEIPDDQNWQFYDVQFNKIAVWTGDFAGPEWLLKDYWDEFDSCDMDAPLSVAMSTVEHYGTKGMRWGVRNDGAGETKRAGAQKFLDPQGHDRTTDIIKVGVGVLVPFVGPLTAPAQIRLGRAVVRGVKQKNVEKAEAKFEKNAHSASNFVAIHNGAHEQITRDIETVNKKYSQDLTKDPVALKKYDAEVTKNMQDAYRKSANQLGNKTGTRHLDVEFHNDGLDFKIVAKKGMQTPTVEHAAVDDSGEFGGKIKRAATGHIVGFEFDDFDQENTMAQAEFVTEFMEHHGVKGMRWGVRNDNGGGAGAAVSAGAKKVGRGAKRVGKGLSTFGKDVAFESTTRMHAKTNEVHLTAADNFAKQDIPRINAKFKDTKGGTLKGRLKNPLHPDTRAYRSESRIAYRDRVNEAVKALPGNASGTRKYEIDDQGKTNAQYAWTLKAVDVKKTVQHADSLSGTLLDEFVVRPVFDADGFITDVKMVKSTLAQSADSELAQTTDLGAAYLAHVGVKGMRWGVRKDAPPMAVATSATSVVPHGTKRKTKVKVEGGENHGASDDAIRVAKAHAKLKKSGTAALSNQELQDVQTRLNLERNVRQLSSSTTTVGKGRQFVKGLTGFGKEFNESINTGANTRRLLTQ